MTNTYRRISTQEIDQQLQLRSSKEERIDYLEWLLLIDQEALELSNDENDGFTYVGLNKEGERYLYPSGVWDEQQAELAKRTEEYRYAIQKRLDYFKQARSDAGPFLVENQPDDVQVETQESGVSTYNKTPDKIRWRGNTTDLVYLFQTLADKGFLGKDYAKRNWTFLENTFLDKNWKELKNLKVVWQNIKLNHNKKTRAAEELDSIISQLKSKQKDQLDND